MKFLKKAFSLILIFIVVFSVYTLIYHYQVQSTPKIDLKSTFLASSSAINSLTESSTDEAQKQEISDTAQYTEQTIDKNGFYIRIDKIDLFIPAVKNVDPRYKEVYTKSWEYGVSHGKFTSLPDQIGNVYFFAHAVSDAAKITDNNAWFTRIDELDEGDPIIIYYEGKKYTYQVSRIYTVAPTDTGVYTGVSPVPKITLQTCGPPRGSLKSRYMVEGLQISVSDL